jgi:ABC-2 type transport system permease protein
MTASAGTLQAPPPRRARPASPAPPKGALTRLVITEWKLFARERVGLLWGVGFPLVLLIIFGSIPAFRQPSGQLGGLTYLDAYVPILMAFVLAMLALNALPPVLAGYREKGILRRMSTTPVGAVRVLTAQLAVNLGVALLAVAVIVSVARFAYHVTLPQQAAGFAGTVALTAVALFGLGLFVAAAAGSGRVANAIGAIMFFPMMFFAGLWLPIAAMPSVLRHIASFTPLGAAVQALGQTSAGLWPHPLLLAVLAGYAVVFGGLAARLFRWE